MSEEQIAWTKALEHKRMELIQALVRRDFTEADRLKETDPPPPSGPVGMLME
jgi:tRNA G37 N-methylase TrmD